MRAICQGTGALTDHVEINNTRLKDNIVVAPSFAFGATRERREAENRIGLQVGNFALRALASRLCLRQMMRSILE